jgi:hypothetical protein
MTRTFQAVAVGFGLFTIGEATLVFVHGGALESNATPVFVAASLVFGIALGTGCGWLAARVAGRTAIIHSLLVAAVITVVALWVMVKGPELKWTEMLTMFVYAPFAVVGGMLCERQQRQ